MKSISTEATLRRMKHLRWTIECGMHSNIPRCCVRFYVMQWIFDPEDGVLRTKHRRTMNRFGMANNGYIPCDDCVRHGRVAIIEACPDKDIPCDHSEEQAG